MDEKDGEGRADESVPDLLRVTTPGARRGVAVGFVGTALSARRLLHVAERMDASIRLISAVSETSSSAHAKALQISGNVDVVLFSGPHSYDLSMAQGGLPVPALFVSPGGPALPNALLRARLDRDIDLRFLSIDSVTWGEVSDTYEELGLPASDLHVMEYEASAAPEDFLAFHEQLSRHGESSGAITTLPAVADKLEEMGIPVLTMRPDATALRTALNTAVLVGGGASLGNERMAIVIVRVPESLSPRFTGLTNSSFTELKLTMQQEVLREARRMDALVLPRDDTSLLVCVSMGSLRAATDDLATVPFGERILSSLGFVPDVGIGIGRTVVEAEAQAQRAADQGASAGDGSVFLVGPEQSTIRLPRDRSVAEDAAANEHEPKEARILREIVDAMQASGADPRTVEAEQVAALLHVTLRTARRHLRALVSADLAWELPPVQTNKVGRPPIPYRLLYDRLATSEHG